MGLIRAHPCSPCHPWFRTCCLPALSARFVLRFSGPLATIPPDREGPGDDFHGGDAGMSRPLHWGLVVAVAGIVLVVPILFYRTVYTTSKRLRIVEAGKLYRSGQMTADGFADAVRRLGIRTIVNVQDDYPDPDIRLSAWDPRTVKE